MSIVITHETGSVTFLDPTVGFTQGSAAKYWTKRPVGARRFAKEKTSAPSNDGSIVHRHGFRGMPIGPIEVWYINTTASGCLSAFQADRDAIENKEVSISIPGWSSIPSCDVTRFEAATPKQSGTSLYRLRCVIELMQDRN